MTMSMIDVPAEDSAAGALRREFIDDDLLDRLVACSGERGVELTGEGGFLPELIKAVLERGMKAELRDHLGYDKYDRVGYDSGNSRNGTMAKTVHTEVGPVKIDQPRDRAGSFKSCLLPPGQRRLAGLDDMIISLYAGGMTVREIGHHLEATFGTQISHETISNITEAVQDEVAAWQTRPLEAFYPVMFLDAIQVKIKDQNRVTSRASYRYRRGS